MGNILLLEIRDLSIAQGPKFIALTSDKIDLTQRCTTSGLVDSAVPQAFKNLSISLFMLAF